MITVVIKTPKSNIAGWSSLVARRAHNPKVVGSNPAPATISLEVSNLEASSFLVFLGFSKDVQNGLILNFTFTDFLTGSRVTDSIHFSINALFSAKELWVNSLEPSWHSCLK